MKGRKPDAMAVRRGLSQLPRQETQRGIAMPDDIASDPVRSKIWSWVCPEVNTFAPQDVPIVRELVTWHAVFLQCEKEVMNENGSSNLIVPVGSSGKGATSPYLSQMKTASSEIRALSEMLGLSPLARSRIGLMDATTVKTAADTAAMFAAIEDAYGALPEAEILEVEAQDAED